MEMRRRIGARYSNPAAMQKPKAEGLRSTDPPFLGANRPG